MNFKVLLLYVTVTIVSNWLAIKGHKIWEAEIKAIAQKDAECK